MNLRKLIALFNSINNPITQGNNRLILYATALGSLGTDASPNDVAPDEVGCAETVNAIHKKAFGYEIGGTLSTYNLYAALKKSKYFIKVDRPLEGDVVISPTGYGNGGLSNGHVGIVGTIDNNDLGKSIIMSNDSATGLFKENYTIKKWEDRYKKLGGYPVDYFRRV